MTNDGLGALAKKWLRAKAKELTTADQRTREASEYEAQETARQLKNDSIGEAVMTAIPGLRRLRDQQQAQARAADERRDQEWQDELASRPVATLRLATTGAIDGEWSGLSATRVDVSVAETDGDDDWVDPDPYAGRPTLVVDAGPLVDGDADPGPRPMTGWRFEVPGYAGPGSYDLAAIGMDRRRADAEPEYIDWVLAFGDEGPLFFFQPDVGPSTVEITDDRCRLDVTMALVADAGELTVRATFELPAPLPGP